MWCIMVMHISIDHNNLTLYLRLFVSKFNTMQQEGTPYQSSMIILSLRMHRACCVQPQANWEHSLTGYRHYKPYTYVYLIINNGVFPV